MCESKKPECPMLRRFLPAALKMYFNDDLVFMAHELGLSIQTVRDAVEFRSDKAFGKVFDELVRYGKSNNLSAVALLEAIGDA